MKNILVILIAVQTLVFADGNGAFMHGHNSYGGFMFGLIILIFVIVGLYFLYSKGNLPLTNKETPLEILKRRLASGEITDEEYQNLKNTLDK